MSYTTRLGFFIPAGSDAADVQTLIDALNKLDGTSGFILCTEATKPTTNNYPGKYIKCTDSGKHYYLDGTGTWSSGTYTGGAWVEDFYVTAIAGVGVGNLIYGANTILDKPYALGAISGDFNNGNVDVANNTLTDVVSCAFALASTTNVKVEATVDLFRFTSNTFGAQNRAYPYATGFSTAFRFYLYDGSTRLAEMFFFKPNTGTVSDQDNTVHLYADRLVSLASGSHTLKITVYNEGVHSGSTSSAFLGINASLVATVSA